MRKLLLSLACLLFMTGLVVAAEYAVVSYDKDTKTFVLKDGDKEVKAKVTDSTKVTLVDKDGNKKELKIGDVSKKWGDKTPKKIDATVEKGEITEITVKGKK